MADLPWEEIKEQARRRGLGENEDGNGGAQGAQGAQGAEPQQNNPAPMQGPGMQPLPGSAEAQGFRAVDPEIQRTGGMRTPEIEAYNDAWRRNRAIGFEQGMDPTNREELMRNLAGREGSPTMDAAQAAGTTVGPAATIGGVGTNVLASAATGARSAALIGAEERAHRRSKAEEIGVRGSQNIGLAKRIGAAEREGATKASFQTAHEMALNAAQASAGVEAQQAQLDQQVTTLQANLQQQLNLSNAEMQQMSNKVNLEVEAQLAIETDKRLNELMRMGVDEEIARQQAQEEAWKFKSELMFNYWQAAAQDRLGRDIAILEDTSTTWAWDDDPEDIMGEKYESSKVSGDVGESFEEFDLGTESSLTPDVGANLGTLTGGEIGSQNAVRGLDSLTQSKSGGMAEMDAGYDYSGENYPGNIGIAEEAMAREVSTSQDVLSADQARVQAGVDRTNSVLDTMGQAQEYGNLALNIFGGDKEQAADTAVRYGRQKGEAALTDYLASSDGAGMGKYAAPAVKAGSLAFDVATEDDSRIDPSEQTAYGVRKAAASTGGSMLGSWLGGLAGGGIGTAAGGPYGAAVGSAIGSTVGGISGAAGMGALDEGLWGGMPTRTVHSGQIEQKRMEPSVTSADLEDPSNLPDYEYAAMGEKFESPSYGGKQQNLAELEELRRRLNGGR
mgnify:FL=1|tara:strand:+ start:1257 stop:3275 length:2019 start_codon:yes stop_codon:yes gene_type:complete